MILPLITSWAAHATLTRVCKSCPTAKYILICFNLYVWCCFPSFSLSHGFHVWTKVSPSQLPKSLHLSECPALCEKYESAQRCYGPCNLVEFLATIFLATIFLATHFLATRSHTHLHFFCCFSSLCFPFVRNLVHLALRTKRTALANLSLKTTMSSHQ